MSGWDPSCEKLLIIEYCDTHAYCFFFFFVSLRVYLTPTTWCDIEITSRMILFYYYFVILFILFFINFSTDIDGNDIQADEIRKLFRRSQGPQL